MEAMTACPTAALHAVHAALSASQEVLRRVCWGDAAAAEDGVKGAAACVVLLKKFLLPPELLLESEEQLLLPITSRTSLHQSLA